MYTETVFLKTEKSFWNTSSDRSAIKPHSNGCFCCTTPSGANKGIDWFKVTPTTFLLHRDALIRNVYEELKVSDRAPSTALNQPSLASMLAASPDPPSTHGHSAPLDLQPAEWLQCSPRIHSNQHPNVAKNKPSVRRRRWHHLCCEGGRLPRRTAVTTYWRIFGD